MQTHEHLRSWADLSEFTELYQCDVLAKPDLREPLLVLGSGHVRWSALVQWQRDMPCNSIVQCHRCHRRHLCWSGLVPWRSDLPRNRHVRD